MVYLTGAGCGDPKLLTLRAAEVLEDADVIVYDALIDETLLERAPQAERIYVGKRSSAHTLSQDEINALLVELSDTYENVVRLKGGDPYVFGRGGEEGEYLRARGVPFEVIPGISSAIGGLAYAGIPVTHREYSSSFLVLTGHRKDTADAYDYETLARFDGTLVFVMGVARRGEIAEALIAGGKKPETPAAIVYKASTPEQETTVTTLGELAETPASSPALLVIGEVVALQPILGTFEKSTPLYGKRVLVTRAKTQSGSFSEMLRERRAIPVEMATIQIVPDEEEGARLARAIGEIDTYAHLIFTSANAVTLFFDALERAGKDARALAPLRVYAIGSGTARRLREYGIRADATPKSYIAESLAESVLAHVKEGEKILLPRSGEARPTLVEALREAATVEEIKIYKTREDLSESERVRKKLEEGRIDAITFTSSSTVRNFSKAFSPEDVAGVALFSIGPQTSATLEEYGYPVTAEAKEYALPGLLECMENYYEKERAADTAAKE